jgi:F420H(2)-dependent quinone reductase
VRSMPGHSTAAPAGLPRSRTRGVMPAAKQRYDVPTRGLLTKAEGWLYPGGHPNGLARLLNRGWSVVHATGLLPKRYVTLEVPGRRTGRILSFPLVVADYQGERYLVSMLGESSNWLRNVRAAGGRAVLRHGRREAVRLEEVDPDARAPVVRRYLSLAPGPRAFIPVDPDAPLDEFQKVAPRIPVFRVRRDRAADSATESTEEEP